MTQKHHEGKSYTGNGIEGSIIPTFSHTHRHTHTHTHAQKKHTRNQLNDHITDNNTATFCVNN